MWYDEINHFFSNGKSHYLLEWTFGFHLNPKKPCWEISITTQSSFQERCVFFSPILERETAMGANQIAANSADFASMFMIYTKLKSWRHNDHFELKFVQIGQELPELQPRKVSGTGKQSDFFHRTVARNWFAAYHIACHFIISKKEGEGMFIVSSKVVST